MSIDYPANQGDVAWGNTLPQHQGKAALEGFFRAFYGPLSGLTAAMEALRESRGLETAAGAQLDGIGSIVGVNRVIPNSVFLAFFGYSFQSAGRGYGVAPYRKSGEPYAVSFTLSDEPYLNLIKAKIIQNNSHGVVDDIIAVIKLLFAPVMPTGVSRSGIANLSVNIFRISTGLDTLLPYYLKFLPISAGISYTINLYNYMTTVSIAVTVNGDTTVDVVSSTGITAGKTVAVELNNGSVQIATVSSVSGNVLTLSPGIPVPSGSNAGKRVFLLQ